MSKVAIEFNARQIESVIDQLDSRSKWKIAKDIIHDQFRDVILEFRKRIKSKGLTHKQVSHIVETARAEFHAKSRH